MIKSERITVTRVALVTGASSGIGLACAVALSKSGYKVYGASRGTLQHPEVHSIRMDVTDSSAVLETVAFILKTEGRIDVVVNSAGYCLSGAVDDTSPEEAFHQFDVNLFGVVRVCRSVLPAMRKQGSGHVVNIGSIGGLIAIPYQGIYSASKFALEGLSEALRMELRPFGVHVVLIEPGDYQTGLTKNRIKTRDSGSSPVYRERFEKAVFRMAEDEQSGPTPQAVAKLLMRILGKARPRLRYTTGPLSQRAAVWLKRLAPNSLVEKIITAYYSR